jgi:phosphatidylserine/phosphatidylglycerophosphate/cardiolipin synthase-like enzyme
MMRLFHALVFLAALTTSIARIDASAQVYFSPEDHLADHLLELINKEEKSIRVAIYGFTHYRIATALINAKKRGVKVEVLIDPFSIGTKTPIKRLVDAGIAVHVFSPKNVPEGKHPLLHDKFCVFGETLVWTGSFNFTYSADTQHQENAVLIDDKEIVERFSKKFASIKRNSCVSYSTYGKKSK